LHAEGKTPFALNILQMRQVSSTTFASVLLRMRSAERLISFVSSWSSILIFPRLCERYWQTAAGVIPSFSAASFWFNPKLVIMLSAISFRMTGSPFHITYSQGVRFIEGYKRSFILISSVFYFLQKLMVVNMVKGCIWRIRGAKDLNRVGPLTIVNSGRLGII